LLKPLHLSTGEKRDLLAFLRALTGDNATSLAVQARAAASGGSTIESVRDLAIEQREPLGKP
jgi:hypothetical protein